MMATTLIIDHRPKEAKSGQKGYSMTLARAPEPAVTVNGIAIPRAAIAREVQHHPSATPIEAWWSAARALVVRELLAQEARRLNVAAEPRVDERGRRETGEDAILRTLLEREISTPTADEETCRRYYQRNLARFTTPTLFAAAHILFSADRRDMDAYAVATAQAKKIIAALATSPERFAEFARTYSACPSGGLGGDLGQVTAEDVTPAFAAALTRMTPGEIAPEPVETDYGIHIVRLDRRIRGHVMPFEIVREKIADYLAESAWRRAAAQYVALLVGRATITGIELGGTNTPLVQ
jgi:peptidyl-prolyl cis-trans isomerase C